MPPPKSEIWRTTNGGTLWTRTNLEPAPYTFQSLEFVDRLHGWGISSYNVLVHTTDGGDSWSCQLPLPYLDNITAAEFVDSLHGWLSGRANSSTLQLWTDDGGGSWQMTQPTANPFNSIHFIDRWRGWATAYGSELYKTLDGGLTWTVAYNATPYGLSGVTFVDSLHGWCFGSQNVSTNATIHTTDGGATWTAVPFPSWIYTWDGFAARDSLEVWMLADLQMDNVMRPFRSTDGGLNWLPSECGFSVTDINITRNGSVWLVGAFSQIARSSNGGETWINQRSLVTGAGFYGAVAANERVWAVGEGAVILHSDNGGSYWYPQPSGAPPATLNAIAFVPPNHLWAAGDAGTLLASANGGNTWTMQASGTTSNLRAVAFADSLHGWLAGYGPTLKHTTNGGATWTDQLPAGAPNPVSKVCCVTADSAWAIAGPYVYRTIDGGATWSPWTAPAGYTAQALSFVDRLTGWCAGRITGNAGFVLKTTDGGQNWTPQQPLLPSGTINNVTDIHFVDPHNGWLFAEGSFGNLIRQTTDGGLNWMTDAGGARSLRVLAGNNSHAVWGFGYGGTIQRQGTATAPQPVMNLVVIPVNPEDLQLRWTAAPGFAGTYTVYASTDLLPFPDAGWTTLASGITPAPAGGPTTWTDVNAAQTLPRRYYTVTAVLSTPAPASTLPPEVRARLTQLRSEHPPRPHH